MPGLTVCWQRNTGTMQGPKDVEEVTVTARLEQLLLNLSNNVREVLPFLGEDLVLMPGSYWTNPAYTLPSRSWK